jgi:hypothetical protein
MTDQIHKPQGTFSKLMPTAIPRQEQKPEKLEIQQSSMPESQKSRKMAFENSGKQESQHAGNPASQQTGKAKPLANQVPTEKVSYRFHAEGKYAVEDMKLILARKHGIKASLEEIAEACILLAYDDLLENQNASKLASRLARTPENQKSS